MVVLIWLIAFIVAFLLFGLIGVAVVAVILFIVGISENMNKRKSGDYSGLDYYEIHSSLLGARKEQIEDEYDLNDYLLSDELSKCKNEEIKNLITDKVKNFNITSIDARKIIRSIREKEQ